MAAPLSLPTISTDYEEYLNSVLGVLVKSKRGIMAVRL